MTKIILFMMVSIMTIMQKEIIIWLPKSLSLGHKEIPSTTNAH